MRTISADFRKALYNQETGDVIVMLVTFIHPLLPGGEFLVSSDNKDLLNFEEQLWGTVSRGKSYAFLPMEVSLPEDGDQVQPLIQMTLFDVADRVAPLLQQAVSRVLVTIEIVTASAPDDIEVEFAAFEVSGAELQGNNVVLSLIVDAMADEPWPADNFTPSSFPGLFAQF